MTRLLTAIAFGALILACGGDDDGADGSGVDRSKYMDELSASEKSTFCEWSAATQGGAGTTDCGDGVSVTVPSAAECAAEVSPHCQVGLAEDCVLALDGNPCGLFASQACAAWVSCLMGS